MNIVEQLAELQISQQKGFHWRQGADQKLVCPQCQGGSSKEKSLSFKFDNEGGAVWKCHRATCGWSGNIPGSRIGVRNEPRYERPVLPDTRAVPDALTAWFQRRGISRAVLDKFGIYRTARFIPQVESEVAVTAFPYTWKGEVMNVKYRYDYRKEDGTAAKTFIQEKMAEPSLYNADNLNADEVIFVEGEMDVLSLAEAGFCNAVSLKDGAPTPRADGSVPNSDKRYDPLKTHWKELKECQRFVLAGDMDGPGRALIEELARRLGKAKCHIVDWPEGCKDANDTLLKLGTDGVKGALAAARPHPVEGLWNAEEDDILVLDDDRWTRTVSTGSPKLDEVFRVPTEAGRLFVVTGVPNMGKSTFIDWLLVNLARQHGLKSALFSPETSPWQLHLKRLAEIYIGKQWKLMDVREKLTAMGFCGKHFTHIVQDDKDDAKGESPTLDWLLQQVENAVLRDGVKNVLIDPWNEIEHGRPATQSTTEYTNDAVRRIKRLCSRLGVNVFLIAHPRKTPVDEVPNGFHVADSAAFWNKADFGITIHRPDNDMPNKVLVHVWKVRFKAMGKKGDAFLFWDGRSDRFHDTPDACRD